MVRDVYFALGVDPRSGVELLVVERARSGTDALATLGLLDVVWDVYFALGVDPRSAVELLVVERASIATRTISGTLEVRRTRDSLFVVVCECGSSGDCDSRKSSDGREAHDGI